MILSQSKRQLFFGAGWLVSFGDLLTLLLCLFITIISQSPLNRHYSASKVQAKSEETNVPPAAQQSSAVAHPAGIDVAQTKDGIPGASAPRLVEMRFTESDFDEENRGTLRQEALERLKTEVSSRAYLIERAGIETCDGDSGGSGWYLATVRAVSLRSQVIDSGLNADLTGLRVAGSACRALGSGRHGSKDATAVVELKLRG